MPATDAETAHAIGARIAQLLRNAQHDIGGLQLQATISIGCATQAPQSPIRSMNGFVHAAWSAQSCGRSFSRTARNSLLGNQLGKRQSRATRSATSRYSARSCSVPRTSQSVEY